MRNYSIKNLIWTKRGHELDEIAENILNEENEYYILGTNEELAEFYNRIGKFLDRHICGYVGDESGLLTENISVNDKCNFTINENTKIICTYKNRENYENAKKYWHNMDLQENQRFFQGEVFEMIYDVYARNQIKIDRVEIFLTSCCTLTCEKCIAYIPYFEKPTIVPLQQLKDDADLLFEKVDYIYKLKLLGGEGFLYPYLIEYIDYLYEHYGYKIGSIRIGTNGTIFPTQAVLEMCKRNHVTVDISDYTAAVPSMCLLDEVKKICEDNKVRVDIKRTGEQWLDMGFPEAIPEKKTEEELREHFAKCAMFCRQFSAGKYYFCCSNFAAVKANLFPQNDNDYFDFRKEFSKKELLEFELGYSLKGHTTFCTVCNGCSEESNPRHVEVAKQISRTKKEG